MNQPEVLQNSNQNVEEKKIRNDSTKQSIRRKTWEYLERNNLVNFPRPVYGRIPNFKGSDEAAAKLLELEEFISCKYIEVNPDKPQEGARMLVLENQKELYVPVPRLKEGLLKYIPLVNGSNKNEIRQAVSRRSIEDNGKTISINDLINIDMLVLGSVAVSKEGYRIGKGRGYADLEFAILLEMKAVNENTVIVTTVHDSQVYDTLPKELFQNYDVPVDYILTPTQIIKVQDKLPKPPGIIWNILSKRRLNLMPVLQALKAKHESDGKDTTLKEVDTDVESHEQRKFNRFRKLKRRRPRSEGKAVDSQGEEVSNENVKPRRPPYRRFYRRPRMHKSEEHPNENGNMAGGENNQSVSATRDNVKRSRRPFRRMRPQIDFSLMVSNIEKTVRVRDLKNALNEKGIKPNDITWRGSKGLCYLHYTKPNIKSKSVEHPTIIVDNVIEILQNMKIGPDSETNLSVKIMEPISRIETTDVTAV